MDKLTALSLSIGILSGVATFLAVGPAAGVFFIWAATIAGSELFCLERTKEAVINTIVNGIFGVFMAWLNVPLTEINPNAAPGFNIMAAVTVAVAVVVLFLYCQNTAVFSYLPMCWDIPQHFISVSNTR